MKQLLLHGNAGKGVSGVGGCWVVVVAKSGDQKEIWKRFNNNNGPRV